MIEPGWIPPYTLEERLKYALIPPALYMRRLIAHACASGEAEIHLLPFLVERGRTSLDIGANKGVYTHLLAPLSHHVHAFEPNPKIFRILARSLPANVEAHPVALSNEDGIAEVMVPARKGGYSNQGATLSHAKPIGPHKTFKAEMRRLDSYGFDDVGFIKVDVEGFEQQVLEGAEATLRRSRPTLLIEIEEKHRREPIERALAAVEALGYQGLFLRKGTLTPLTSFDPEGYHRKPASRADYVFNFAFLPLPTA